MRSPLSTSFLTGLVVVTMTVLLPSTADAQRARSGGSSAVRVPPGGGGGRAVPRTYHYPSHRPTHQYYRPYYYRPYYYRPYYSNYGYYPYYGYYYPYYYPYRPYWSVGFSVGVGYGWGYPYYGWGGYPYAYGGYGYGGYYPPYDGLAEARLQVSPRQTEVYVDGYFAGTVDDFDGFSQRLRLAPGEHDVQLYLEGHRPLREKLMFTVGNTLRVRHTMEPLTPGEATPDRPKPEPTAARPAPSTPYSRGPGRPPMREPQTREPSTAIEIDRPTAYGSLVVRVQPGDAELLIDGEVWTSPDPRRPLVVQLSEGVHRIEVRKRGFTPYRSEVEIRAGETSSVNVSLAQPERL